MHMRLPYLIAAPALIISGLAVAPTAAADCEAYNGTMICSDDGPAAAGNDGNPSDSRSPSVPYPCDLDWYCDVGSTWDLGSDVDERPPAPPPSRPDIGLPGRPGNRPGGGGGGGGNRPGGGGGGGGGGQ